MNLTLKEERLNTRIYEGVNRKGERVSVWATRIVVDFKNKKSIASAWLKAGFITEKIPSYWNIENFVTLPNRDCCNRYNPQIKFEDGRHKINFDYILPATEENLAIILDNILARAEA